MSGHKYTEEELDAMHAALVTEMVKPKGLPPRLSLLTQDRVVPLDEMAPVSRKQVMGMWGIEDKEP